MAPDSLRATRSVVARLGLRDDVLTARAMARGDAVAAGALWLGTLGYVAGLWPHSVSGYDEGQFVYGAARIAGGEVMYRDIFDIVTPLSFYALAGVFSVFAVSITTTRVTLGLMLGATATIVYGVARRLGVRPAIAVLAGGFCVGLAFPASPYMSPHWCATLCTVLLLGAVIGAPAAGAPRAAGIGALSGALILTQQQKGLPIALAVAVILCTDAWPRRGTVVGALPLRVLTAYGLGATAALVVVLGPLALIAGWESLFEALVKVPLVNYRGFTSETQWRLFLPGRYSSIPLLINGLPLLVAVAAARVVTQWWGGASFAARRPFFVSTVFAIGALVSVLYLPDYAHLAVIAPIWICPLAELLEAAVRRFDRLAPARRRGAVALLLAALAYQLWRGLDHQRRVYPVVRETAYGEIAFRSQREADDVDWLRDVFARAGTREAFIYPYAAYLYLLTGASNPTRYPIIFPGFHDASQFAEAIAALERRQVPFVVRGFFWWKSAPPDPIIDHLRAHYEKVRPQGRATPPIVALWRRKAAPAGAGGPGAAAPASGWTLPSRVE